nr:Unknown Function [uncultured bacterium]
MKFQFDKGGKRVWLAIVGTGTLILLVAFAMAQQGSRLGAEDAPLALSASIATHLDSGSAPQSSIPSGASDTQLFAMITDSSQKVLAASTSSGSAGLTPPTGSFIYAKNYGIDKFTWQPDSHNRYATIIVYKKPYYIVTGQSLTEPERRIALYGSFMLLAWLVMLIWTTLVLTWNRK